MKKLHLVLVAALLVATAANSDVGARTVRNSVQQEQQNQKTDRKKARAEKKENRKLNRAIRQALEEKKDSILFVEALNSLEKGEFVLEADRLVLPNNRTAFVTATTNFVNMHDQKSVIQIASNSGHLGFNWLGGITVEGTVSNIGIQEDPKSGNITYEFSILGAAVSARAKIVLIHHCDRAVVTIRPNLNNRDITLGGRIRPYDKSLTFKGRSI